MDVDVETSTMPAAMVPFTQKRDVKTFSGETRKIPYWPAGTVYETTNAAFFVRQGMAEPADMECSEACGMTSEQMKVAQHACQRQAKGILPKDWELFDAGYIVGYDAAGNYEPGAKWDE